MSLVNIVDGKSVDSTNLQILDNNFEYLRIKYNAFCDRINPYLERLKAPYNKDPLAYIERSNLNILAEKTTLTAEDLNGNFNLFRNRLLAIGVNKLSKDVTILDNLPLLTLELPLAPSNLLGNLIDDGTDAIEGLTWQDNADNEQGFELYERFNNTWGSKETVGTPSIESCQTELVRASEYEIGDYLLLNTELNPNHAWKIRAFNGYGYSNFSNTVEYNLTQPSISFNSIELYPENIHLDILGYQNNNIVRYLEIWIAYSPNILEEFIDTPWQLIAKSELLNGEMLLDWTMPEPNMSGDDMLNQYLFIKVRGYSAIKRSEFSYSGFGTILPPATPINLTGVLNTFYYNMGGDALIELDWVNKSGNNTDIEVWGKWGSGDYQLLSTVSQSYGHVGFNHNIGRHPTGTYYYKLRAVNDSGESEFSGELAVNTFAPASISNLSGTLNNSNPSNFIVNLAWQNNDSYSQIEIWNKIDSGSYNLGAITSGLSSLYSYNLGVVDQNHTYYFKVRGIK